MANCIVIDLGLLCQYYIVPPLRAMKPMMWLTDWDSIIEIIDHWKPVVMMTQCDVIDTMTGHWRPVETIVIVLILNDLLTRILMLMTGLKKSLNYHYYLLYNPDEERPEEEMMT